MRFIVDECTGPSVAAWLRDRILRLADNRSSSKIHILEKLLAGHQDSIEGNFITITEKKIRISRA